MKMFLMMVLCLCAVTLTGMAGVEKQVDKVITEQGITVNNDLDQQLDSMTMLLNEPAPAEIGIDDLGPMVEGEGWLRNNWKWLLSLLIVALEIILRIKPTTADWSIVNKILAVLLWIFRWIPNNAKVNEEVHKRGYDVRMKKIVDKLKK